MPEGGGIAVSEDDGVTGDKAARAMEARAMEARVRAGTPARARDA